MKIIIDAMSGDNAPQEIVAGAVKAADELGVEIVFVGREAEVRACLGSRADAFPVINADDVITMEDDPSTATRRKKNSSMAVALRLLSEGDGDAMVSAGSTGALLTGATLTVGRIKGIRRAALAPVLPAGEHGVMLMAVIMPAGSWAAKAHEWAFLMWVRKTPKAASCSTALSPS